jgi:hypothetical protein
MTPLLRFVVGHMLHNRTQFTTGPLARQFQFPIRSEGVSMVTFVLNARERYETPAKRLVDELLVANFIDQERRLTEHDADQAFMDSSIVFLRLITQCKDIFEDPVIKRAGALLESLCMRFSREWMNTSAFGGTPEKRQEKPATRSSQARAVPKLRALTSLGGEVIGAPAGRPGSSSARVSKKPKEKETDVSPSTTRSRPTTAFAKRKG